MLDETKISELTQKLYELKMEANSVMLELTGSMYSTSERGLSLSESDLQKLADRCDLIGDDFKEVCSELTLQIED